MRKISQLMLSAIILFSFFTVSFIPMIPVTGVVSDSNNYLNTRSSADLSSSQFSFSHATSKQVTQANSENLFTLSVVQQPSGNSAYVSTKRDTATQFSLATQHGSIGLIAHNYLAGKKFSNLTSGSVITVTFSDGSKVDYKVSGIYQYQALNPTSPYSKYVDPSSPDKVLSVEDVFNTIYGVSDRLVLQTCITKDGVQSWGRLFVVADPSN
jgi:hypothetical protein